ncbi:hypothetical protein LTR53_010791 [Teratosphaeriaceae sp. CCFEE 6253]|nr:hypothetical protein LTR53_010791 [Teratosphaeriaceae sp. CCFEE 6253]
MSSGEKKASTSSQWTGRWLRASHPDDQSSDAIAQHHVEVEKVAASVRGFHRRGEQFRIFHGSTNSTRKSATGRDPTKVVNTSRLNSVLHVDANAEAPFALVQPNVPMDKLVEATLKHGLVPPVVMEFPGITVGGGYAGTSGESSSFRHGFFDRTLEQVEMVLASGEIVTCSEHEHPDLFRGAAGAVGTLGVTTLVKLRLRKATKFVETTYHPISEGMKEAMAMIQKFADPEGDLDYVDGIMFSKERGAVITGRMTDTPPAGTPIQRFSGARDPWFYLHVQDRVSKHDGPTSDAVPLPEYLFRYDRGGFWVGTASFTYFPVVPFNAITRWFLDDFMHTRMLYRALHGSGQSERMIVQDLALPYATAEEFVDYTDARLGIYPLWLCPLKQSSAPTMHPHQDEYESDEKTLKPMLNIGLWGLAPGTHEAFVLANRDVEQKLHDLGGMKWLYAQTYYSEEEFWRDFDKEWYDALREKYHASKLPTVYEKVKASEESGEKVERTWTQAIIDTWPFSGLYGLTKAIESRDYKYAREATWKQWIPRD